jgi:hypothetical protein
MHQHDMHNVITSKVLHRERERERERESEGEALKSHELWYRYVRYDDKFRFMVWAFSLTVPVFMVNLGLLSLVKFYSSAPVRAHAACAHGSFVFAGTRAHTLDHCRTNYACCKQTLVRTGQRDGSDHSGGCCLCVPRQNNVRLRTSYLSGMRVRLVQLLPEYVS